MGGKKKVGKKVLQQRLLADEENVYMIQNRFKIKLTAKTIGLS